MSRLLEALSAFPLGGHARPRPLAPDEVDWVARAGDDPAIVKWNRVLARVRGKIDTPNWLEYITQRHAARS